MCRWRPDWGIFSKEFQKLKDAIGANDLINAKLTRLQVLASSLDAANFTGNSNPFGTPNNNELPREVFFIDRKNAETRDTVQFELVSRLDQQNKKLPKRQITRAEFPSVGGFINC